MLCISKEVGNIVKEGEIWYNSVLWNWGEIEGREFREVEIICVGEREL